MTALALALAAEVGQAQNGRDQDPGAPGQGADAPGQGREADGALGGGQGAGGGAPTAGGDPTHDQDLGQGTGEDYHLILMDTGSMLQVSVGWVQNQYCILELGKDLIL